MTTLPGLEPPTTQPNTPRGGLTPWTRHHLINTGVIDEAGLNNHPKARTCKACGTPTLAAWQDGYNEPIHVDPITLTPLGELQTLTGLCGTGRRTFTHWGGQWGGLDLRHPWHITRWPAGTSDPVRPEHHCRAPTPDHTPDPRHHQLDPDAPPPF